MNRKNILYALCVFACLILFALFSTSQGVLLTPLVEHYGLTESSQGIPNAALNIGCTIALLTSLVVMGRIAKPKLLIMAMTATIILILPLCSKPGFILLVALYALVGLAVGYIDTLGSSAIADLFHGKSASLMMGALHAVFGIAGIVSPLVMGSLLKGGLQWNWVYLIIAGVGCALYAYVLPVGRGWIREDAGVKSASIRLSREMLARFFGNRDQLLLLAAVLVYCLYFGGVTVWTDRFIDKELNNPALGATALSLFWLGVTASRLLTPLLKVTPLRYIQCAGLLGAAVLLPGVLSGNAYVMAGAVVVSSLLAGAVIPMILHVSCERFSENTLLATTTILLGVYAGQALGPMIIGQMEAAMSIKAGMLFCVAAVGLSGVAAWGIRAKKG